MIIPNNMTCSNNNQFLLKEKTVYLKKIDKSLIYTV